MTFHRAYYTRARESFRVAFEAARNESDTIRDATSPFDYAADERGTVWRLSDDERSGYAVRHTGELVYVFSLDKGRGDALVFDAVVNNRATHLDCFDGFLTAFYTRNGFHRVTSLPNWTPGGPDVVYMATPGNYLHALDRAEDDAR